MLRHLGKLGWSLAALCFAVHSPLCAENSILNGDSLSSNLTASHRVFTESVIENDDTQVKQNIAQAIRDASYRTGVDFKYLIATAQIESGLNPNAKARSSSATGLYQFIESTWIASYKRHRGQLGLPIKAIQGVDERQSLLDLRRDPKVAALIAAFDAAEHQAKLERVLDRPIEGADLYLAHFLGVSGASRFLKMHKMRPTLRAASLFPRAARSNRAIFHTRKGRARSLDEVRHLIFGKLNQAAQRIEPANSLALAGFTKQPGQRNYSGKLTRGLKRQKTFSYQLSKRVKLERSFKSIDAILTPRTSDKLSFTITDFGQAHPCHHIKMCYLRQMSTSTITRVRDLVNSGEMTRAGLARAAGLHANTLRDATEDDWNPTAETLQKLEMFLNSNEERPALVGIEEIIDEARNGKMYILVDDEDRENEGDLIIPAQMATPAAINFMATHGRGLICLALDKARVDELGLEPMSRNNKESMQTAFTISIEAKEGVTTGISAADRARTVSVAIDSSKGADDIVTPGHVFPLSARDGGTLVRAGHTEAAVDISRLAGLNPSGVICEIMNEDGTMARLDDLVEFARLHDLKIGTIRDLIAYRMRNDHLVERVEESSFESDFGGHWKLITYRDTVAGSAAYVLQKGHVVEGEPTLARVHPISVFDDVLGAPGPRQNMLQRSMSAIGEHGSGVIVILTSRVGTAAEWTKDEEIRNIGIGSQILADLGINDMILLSDSRPDLVALEGYGITITSFKSIPE